MANVSPAAEDFDRRFFTVAEVLRMPDSGIISDNEIFELIEGEIVSMQARNPVHVPAFADVLPSVSAQLGIDLNGLCTPKGAIAA